MADVIFQYNFDQMMLQELTGHYLWSHPPKDPEERSFPRYKSNISAPISHISA